MACIFIDGFDKYGFNVTPVTLGEWTNGSAQVSIVAGAYSPGSLRCQGGPFGQSMFKTLPTNYPTLIMGARIRSNFSNGAGFEFRDSGSVQFGVSLDTLGRFNLYRGGTTVFTSGGLSTANTWHYVEIKVTFHNTTGQYAMWVDGVNIVNTAANQNTRNTANNYANAIALAIGGNGQLDFDDLYVFDTTGAFNNSVAGDSVVETQQPNGDSTVQFAVGAATIGAYYNDNGATRVAPTGQEIFLRQYTPEANCTLNSILFNPAGTNAGAKFTGLCFADNAGAPGTLLSATNEQIGCVFGVALSTNLLAPQSLTAGVPIWIGFMQNGGIGSFIENLKFSGVHAAYTYTLGPPVTCPVVTSGDDSWQIWGSVTTTSNFTEVKNLDIVPDSSLRNYISSDVVGAEDLYTFPVLSSIPVSVSAIKVSAFCQKSDAGGRQLDLRIKSGATDSGGNSTNNPMSATFEFVSSIFDNDPSSGLQWDATSVNNALSGIKVSG